MVFGRRSSPYIRSKINWDCTSNDDPTSGMYRSDFHTYDDMNLTSFFWLLRCGNGVRGSGRRTLGLSCLLIVPNGWLNCLLSIFGLINLGWQVCTPIFRRPASSHSSWRWVASETVWDDFCQQACTYTVSVAFDVSVAMFWLPPIRQAIKGRVYLWRSFPKLNFWDHFSLVVYGAQWKRIMQNDFAYCLPIWKSLKVQC